jgi:hypothetical protein
MVACGRNASSRVHFRTVRHLNPVSPGNLGQRLAFVVQRLDAVEAQL